MLNLKNIHPLSDFLRNAKSHISRLARTGEPAILTVNGQAEAVVLSADAYQKLMEDLETQKTLNSVHQGTLEAFRDGQVSARELLANLKTQTLEPSISAKDAFAHLDRKFAERRKKKAS